MLRHAEAQLSSHNCNKYLNTPLTVSLDESDREAPELGMVDDP